MGWLVLDAQGRVVDCNAFLAGLLRVEVADLVGRPWTHWSTFGRVGTQALVRRWQRRAASREPLVLELRSATASLALRWYPALLDPQPRWPGTGRCVTLVAVRDVDGHAAVARRQADFLRALGDTQAAAAQAEDAKPLHDAICRIVVESGHAALAWIGELVDDVIVPVAWSAGGRTYTHGMRIDCAPGGADAHAMGLSARAVREGATQVANDFMTDPRTRPWRDRAVVARVRSSAAFPIRREGRVAAVLNLYFREVGAFDRVLVGVMEQLVGQVSLALDRIDRLAARRHAEAALHATELQLADVVDTVLDAVIVIDARQQIRIFNRAAVRMFGIPAQAAIGSGIGRIIPDRDRQRHAGRGDPFSDALAAPRTMGPSRPLVGLRADGSEFPIEASISRVGSGDRLLMTLVARDVTLQRAGEIALQEHAATAATDGVRSALLARVSHELRTPLNAVLGFAQLLQLNEHLSDAGTAQMELLQRAGWQLADMIDELMDLSRLAVGEFEVAREPVDVLAATDLACRTLEPQALERGIALVAPPPVSPPRRIWVRADRRRLGQVLLSLLSNPLRDNRRGGWVRIGIARVGATVELTIEDNGPGMSQAQRDQRFQPSTRLGREGGTAAGSGLGLGLVLVKELVQRMGGTLAIDSWPDRGTQVRLAFAACDEEVAPTPGA